jgi:hypothetical protein
VVVSHLLSTSYTIDHHKYKLMVIHLPSGMIPHPQDKRVPLHLCLSQHHSVPTCVSHSRCCLPSTPRRCRLGFFFHWCWDLLAFLNPSRALEGTKIITACNTFFYLPFIFTILRPTSICVFNVVYYYGCRPTSENL